jgi:hypothetical protein
MLQIVDDHEAGQITSSEVEHEIEDHMQAMERIGLPEIHQSIAQPDLSFDNLMVQRW